jgi:hypothetical protein
VVIRILDIECWNEMENGAGYGLGDGGGYVCGNGDGSG